MITLGASEVLVLVLAVALVGVLLSVLPHWRRAMSGGSELPIHRHAGQASIDAEVRCALCAGRQECLRRETPLPDCPNLELLQKRKAL